MCEVQIEVLKLDKIFKLDLQHDDRHKGDLIEMNATLVDRTLTIIRSAIANQVTQSL